MQPIKSLEELFRSLDQDEAKDLEEGKIKNARLKQDVARYMLQNIDDAEAGKISRDDAANMIASFVQYMFDDKLEIVTSLASDLELPQEQLERSHEEIWKDMQTKLLTYLRR